MTRIDDITLMAFADGQLGEDEARAVERALKDDPEAQHRVEAFRNTGALLMQTYSPLLEETIPEKLLHAADGGHGAPPTWRKPRTWMALAASITVIVSAGALSRNMLFKQEEPVLAQELASSAPIASGGAGAPSIATPPPYPAEPMLDMSEDGAMSYNAPPSTPMVAAKRMSPESYGISGMSGAVVGSYIGAAPPGLPYVAPEPQSRERYQQITANPVKRAAEEPVSTFSIDVDTGSYANLRRFLESGRLPPKDAVRIEEMINYFTYAYPLPESSEAPFSLSTDMAPALWNKDLRLLRIGLKGYEVAASERPAANLVFLLDVSGSMDAPNKLPLLKASLRLLTRQMSERDRVSIVVYAGQAGAVLEPTPGNDTQAILAALDGLSVGGSTAGGAGIRLAYAMAEKAFIKDGVNRIVLATDGDFNVGVADAGALKDLVAEKRKSGVSLTTLGFGDGNYYEEMMEQIADAGNGNYAYIDSLKEARKVLVKELGSTLHTIAGDVKIQVEFNPATVAEYRLIGYENRVLKREDFSNDKVDAGDLGAGHTVTALYEIALADGKGQRIDPLRYGAKEQAASPKGGSDELAFVRLRYKLPGEDASKLIEVPLPASMADNKAEAASDDLRFAAAVAAFGQLLRGGTYTGAYTYTDVAALARGALGDDRHGYRREFVELAEIAAALETPAKP